MSKKFVGSVLVVFVLVFGILTLEAYARDSGKTEKHHGDFEKKFSYKARFILENKKELGLSDEQVKKIKDLKIKTKKDLIRKKAELDILALDIKGELWKGTIDTDRVNKLIDKKYELKKERAKSSVNTYVALKSILTNEQSKKMKELRKKCKKEMMHGSMMKGKMKSHMMGQ